MTFNGDTMAAITGLTTLLFIGLYLSASWTERKAIQLAKRQNVVIQGLEQRCAAAEASAAGAIAALSTGNPALYGDLVGLVKAARAVAFDEYGDTNLLADLADAAEPFEHLIPWEEDQGAAPQEGGA